MEKILNIDKIISEAVIKGVNFGKSDPYNRLRYFTKIGWLPHMTRQTDSKGRVKGHYPEWVINRLVLIEDLKNQNLTNEEITTRISQKDKLLSIKKLVNSKEIRNQVISYATLAILLIIFTIQLGIVDIGKSNNFETDNFTNSIGAVNIFDSGTAFMPKNKRTLFVKSESAATSKKIYITFNDNYYPATRFWISEIDNYKGFKVELDTPVSQNTEFNWWISN